MNQEIISTARQTDITAKPVLRSGGTCDFYGETSASDCPECKEPTLLNPAVVGILGLVMALLGTFLMLFTGWIWSLVSDAAARRSMSADPAPLYFILGALIALGAVFTFTGVVQFYQERRNMKLVGLSFISASAFYTICQIIRHFWR